MTNSRTRIIGVLALTLLAALAAFLWTPFSQFLQSSLIGGSNNTPGLYVQRSVTTASGTQQQIGAGISLASDNALSSSRQVSVAVRVHSFDTTQSMDSMRAVLSYDPNQLTIGSNVNNSLDLPNQTFAVDSFTQVLRDTSGKETGRLLLGINKTGLLTQPMDEVVRVRFTVATGVTNSNVGVETLRLYNRQGLVDNTGGSLFLDKNEGTKTYEALTMTFDGTRVERTEQTLADSTKQVTDKVYTAANALLKTTVTNYDSQGRVKKVVTTYANGVIETEEYEYPTAGGWKKMLTTKAIDGKTSSQTETYDSQGRLQDRTNVIAANTSTTTSTGTTVTSTGSTVANANANRNASVVSAVTNTNTNIISNLNTNAATTTATCNAPSSERFTDTVGHWSDSIVEQARQKCIISGKSLGRFAPDEPVTRAELTKIAVEAFKVSQANGATGFADVSDSEWYAAYVRAAKLAQIVNGYSDGTFKPNNQVNRAEALKIVLEAGVKTRGTQLGINVESRFSSWLNQNPTYTYVRFPDVKIADWFGKYVLSAFERGIVRGYNDRGTDVFRPAQPVTRAEAVKMIMSLVQ